jgi:hypothetical protein
MTERRFRPAMTERRTPYRAPRRRPLEPQAPLRHLAALPPGDERAIAERLLLDLTAYYGVQGWRGVDGVLAGRCRSLFRRCWGRWRRRSGGTRAVKTALRGGWTLRR